MEPKLTSCFSEVSVNIFFFQYRGHRSSKLFPSEYPNNILCAFVTSSLKRRTNANTIIIIIIITTIIIDQSSKWIQNWAVLTVLYN